MEMEQAETKTIKRMLEYINAIDDYTLGIIDTIISPSAGAIQRLTTADLARIHGISRQGMHRKLLDTWAKYPELKSLLKGALMMARKRPAPPRDMERFKINRLKDNQRRINQAGSKKRPVTEAHLLRVLQKQNVVSRKRRKRRFVDETPELSFLFQ